VFSLLTGFATGLWECLRRADAILNKAILEEQGVSQADVPVKRGSSSNDGPPQIFISYAWGDNSSEDARKRTEVVTRLCETLEKEGWKILRDTNSIKYGDLISAFMMKMGMADSVIVVLSDKYLHSPYCMSELYAIYRRSNQEKTEFLRRIVPLVLEDACIGTPEERVEHAKHWETRALKLKDDAGYMSEGDFRLYQNMKEFSNHVGAMLTHVNDVLHPHGFQDIVKDDFAALRQMLERRH
jgi:internalin A